jgi:hypothetical protein
LCSFWGLKNSTSYKQKPLKTNTLKQLVFDRVKLQALRTHQEPLEQKLCSKSPHLFGGGLMNKKTMPFLLAAEEITPCVHWSLHHTRTPKSHWDPLSKESGLEPQDWQCEGQSSLLAHTWLSLKESEIATSCLPPCSSKFPQNFSWQVLPKQSKN